MRIVLLPTPGDPFLISYWLRHFEAWQGTTDRIHVCVSWPQEPEVVVRITEDVERHGGRVFYPGYRMEHGSAMELLLSTVDENDVVFFTEDDLYVNDAGMPRAHFERVEQDGAAFIGRSRGSMSTEVFDALLDRYPNGAGLQPAVFGRAGDFRAITESFGARVWGAGETIKGVLHHCVDECSADTFGAAAMEARGRCAVYEAEPMTFPDDPWYHVGSLSTGPLGLDGEASLVHIHEHAPSWERRYEWWRRFYDEWPGGLAAQHEAYGAALDRLHATLT